MNTVFLRAALAAASFAVDFASGKGSAAAFAAARNRPSFVDVDTD